MTKSINSKEKRDCFRVTIKAYKRWADGEERVIGTATLTYHDFIPTYNECGTIMTRACKLLRSAITRIRNGKAVLQGERHTAVKRSMHAVEDEQEGSEIANYRQVYSIKFKNREDAKSNLGKRQN